MAKVNINKLTPIKKGEVKTITIGDQEITVKQYLPMAEKAVLSEHVMNATLDATNLISQAKFDVYFWIEVIQAYTNISFTDKQLEDMPHLYDLLKLNGIIEQVQNALPEDEYNDLEEIIWNDCEHVNKYMQSFLGVLKTAQTDYSNTELNLEQLMGIIKDPAALSTVKDILEKIG